MTARLFIIDAQNDFIDIPDAALGVKGALGDMQRLARFVEAAGSHLTDIVATLDSHPEVAIERPTFWVQGNGEPVQPFTQIKHADVVAGQYLPRDASLLGEVLAYLAALEAGGKYTLMVWTVHCVVGTWGQEVHEDVARALAAWEASSNTKVEYVRKGLNPLTEQYSAVRAEVPREDDERTQTNVKLVDRVRSDTGLIFIGGEASSHCVPATMDDVFEGMTPAEHARVVVLRDCMSPVMGFEAAQAAFFERCAALGVRVMTSDEALALLD